MMLLPWRSAPGTRTMPSSLPTWLNAQPIRWRFTAASPTAFPFDRAMPGGDFAAAIPDKSRPTLGTSNRSASYACHRTIGQTDRTTLDERAMREERTYEEATTGWCVGRRHGGGNGWNRLNERVG